MNINLDSVFFEILKINLPIISLLDCLHNIHSHIVHPVDAAFNKSQRGDCNINALFLTLLNHDLTGQV
jgi:hypothetical protein